MPATPGVQDDPINRPKRARMETDMTLRTPIAAALMLALAAPAAFAWQTSATHTGPRGTSTYTASGSCAGGTCSRDAALTGPSGYTTTRQGSVTCLPGSGSCSGSRTTTLPGGRSWTRSGSVVVTR